MYSDVCDPVDKMHGTCCWGCRCFEDLEKMLCQHSCDDDATSQTAAAAQTAPDHHLDEWILELSDNNVTIWSRPVVNRTYREVKGNHS